MMTLSLTPNGDGTVTVTGSCVITGKPHSVTVDHAGYWRWALGGALIQDALPNTPAEDREFLMTGISPEGWTLAGLDDES